MKVPKLTKRYCPKCKKHTEMAVTQSKQMGRNKTHPMSRGSKQRMRARGLNRGFGNQGKYSRKAIAAFKMCGKKSSKKTDFRYKCKVCGKSSVQKKGFRVKKLEFK